MMSTSAAQPTKINPLDIPEILYRVGEFIPLWTHEPPVSTTLLTLPSISPLKTPTKWGRVDPRWRSQFLFQPHTLLACIRVCTSWHKTLLPLLWHTFDQEAISAPPPPALLSGFMDRFSYLFKVLRWHDGLPDTMRSTQLLNLTLSLDDKHASIQKNLVRTNLHLVSLEWFGLPTAFLDPKDFQGLQRLQHLKIYDWIVSDGRLLEVLGSVAHSLKTLQLHKVRGLCSSDLLPVLPQGRPGRRHFENDNTKDPNSNHKPLRLLHLEHLCVNIELDRPRLETIRALAMCCPNLKHLSIETIGAFHGAPLAHTLRTHCASLAFLAFSCGIQQQQSAAYLIRHSRSEPGLVGIDVGVNSSSPGDLESAILIHASTLKHLKITWCGDDHINSDELLRLLVGCQHLETLSLNFAGNVYVNDSLFEVLSTENYGDGDTTSWGWGSQLRELRLHLPAAPDKRNFPSHELLMQANKGIVRRPADGWELKRPSTFPDRQRYLGMSPVRLDSLFRSVQRMRFLREVLYNMVVFSRIDGFMSDTPVE
ncbi:hypothetical protein BGW39_006251 [Mortierella sp. 14UC]|nr:hypothetical protein BGW39_006251 [Mortierella sp. 14UC]